MRGTSRCLHLLGTVQVPPQSWSGVRSSSIHTPEHISERGRQQLHILKHITVPSHGVGVPSVVGGDRHLMVSLWLSQMLSPACRSTSAASTSFLARGTPPAWCGRSYSR